MFVFQARGITIVLRWSQNFRRRSRHGRLLILVLAETAVLILAELFIGFSIVSKNASLAGLIEISYPIFTALFAYVLFKESQLDTATMIGGVLIFSGVVTIYLFSK